jgi:hypothetical protein
MSTRLRWLRIALPLAALLVLVAVGWLHWGPAIFVAGLGGMLC